MNKEESLALYERGKEAWNEWAKEMLARREDSEAWKDTAKTDLASHTFQEADFSGFIFPGEAQFKGATFPSSVSFDGANFEDTVNFDWAVFEGIASLIEVTFKGNTSFYDTAFRASTWFMGSIFERYTSFKRATFHSDADFKAIQVKSVFTMADVEFPHVPDFEQAAFVEAPRLDNIKIKSEAIFEGDRDLEGRWRTLRRLAVQGHDYASEQLFFRGELLARRWVTDRYWHASFWLGVFYQFFSDFGRSLIRPLLWWAVGVLVFATIYLSYYPGGGEWFLLKWVAGMGNPWVAALGLSLHRSLPALSGFGDALPQFQACLYGVQSENPFRPIIPYEVPFLGVAQILFSAVMIFLFLLAIRNHFRIK